MSRIRVALCVVNPVRNLPGFVLAAFELCQRGVTCFIAPFVRASGEIFALAPDFVLLPAVAPYPFSMSLQLGAAGIQFGFAEVESPFHSPIHELIRAARVDAELTNEITCVCCASSQTARLMHSDRLLAEDRIILTGCPRFDYYVEPLLSTYRKHTSGSKNRGKTVLIDANVAIGGSNFHEMALAATAESSAERERSSSFPGEQTVRQLADLGRQIAADFAETNILFHSNLREVNQKLTREFANHPNLRLARAGNTVSLVLQCAAVIHRGGSSSSDANLSKTPAISPQWIPSPDGDPAADDLSIKCADYPQLRQVLSAALSGTLEKQADLQSNAITAIEHTFYKVDGLAHRRVATGILASLRPEIKPNLKKCRHYFSQQGIRRKLRTATFPGRADDVRETDAGFAAVDAVDDRFSQKEIEKLVHAISEARSAERPKPITISSANRGGAYVSHQYYGRAIMMRCD